MKRVIAVSDSHGCVEMLRDVLLQALEAGPVDTVVFLGDGMRDYDALQPMLSSQGVKCHAVSGNNDWGSYEAQELLLRVDSTVIYACHGHTRHVKYGLSNLWYATRERGAHIALYGHTHCASVQLEQDLLLINPGAVCECRTGRPAYAEISVEPNGAYDARLVNLK